MTLRGLIMDKANTARCKDCLIEPDLVQGLYRATELYGYWPCFHDALWEELSWERARSSSGGAFLQATIAVQRMTSEVDAMGYFKSTELARLWLSFDGVVIDRFQIGMFPDWVSKLSIGRPAEPTPDGEIVVDAHLCSGSLRFWCDECRIERAEAITEDLYGRGSVE